MDHRTCYNVGSWVLTGDLLTQKLEQGPEVHTADALLRRYSWRSAAGSGEMKH